MSVDINDIADIPAEILRKICEEQKLNSEDLHLCRMAWNDYVYEKENG